MKTNDQIANWAMDLQSLAQAGLRYGHDVFDRERYEEIRRIAGEMMSARTGIPEEKLKTLFLGDEGYQTPKIDTRAAIFKDNRILLVREKKTQEWSLPGGWNDYDQTTAQNCVKEAREEAGRIVEPIKILLQCKIGIIIISLLLRLILRKYFIYVRKLVESLRQMMKRMHVIILI